MPATTNPWDTNLDVCVTGLVYNYLITIPGVESVAEEYKKKFNPTPLPQNSPSLQQVYDHFQENVPVKRHLSLTPTPAKKVKKKSNNDAEVPKSENLKIPQKMTMKYDDVSAHSVEFLGTINSLVYDYLTTIPATVSIAEQYKMQFKPPALPQNCPNLQQVFVHFQETAPVKRRLSMNLLSSSTPAKKVKKDTTDDIINLFGADKSNNPTKAITIPHKKEMMKYDQEAELMNALVYNYLKAIPSTASLAEQYKAKFNPPTLPQGYPTLEDIFSHFQLSGPINRRLVLDLSSPSSNNAGNHSAITNNKPAAVESINSVIEALIRAKTTVKKKREPPSAKSSNSPHATIKQSTPNVQDKIGKRKPKMHKPDSYNYSHSTTTTSRPLISTSISSNVKKVTNPTPAFLAWSRWDNSVSNNNPKTCFQCEKIFQRRLHLKIHFFVHMTRMEKRIVQSGWEDVCYFCSKRFICFSALLRHSFLHTKERPFKCDVVDCGKTFTQPHVLKRHSLSHSSNLSERLPFECGVCGQRFRYNHEHNNHVESLHRGIRHKCRWCEATLGLKDSARAHEKKFHPEEFKKESEKNE